MTADQIPAFLQASGDAFYADPAEREAHRKDVDWVTQALRDKVWSLGAGTPADSRLDR